MKKGRKFAKPRKASTGLKAKQQLTTSQTLKIASPQFRGRATILWCCCFQVTMIAINSPSAPKAGIKGKTSSPNCAKFHAAEERG
jgi:hypothetical protein